jgi:hypothetical protein
MFIADLVSLEWDVLRLRRLRLSLIRGRGLERLKYVLDKELDYDLYSERFADCLAEILQEEGQGENAQMLARKCARDEPGAHEKANAVLAGTKLNVDGILKYARAQRAEELVQEYSRRDPDAVAMVNELLTKAAKSMGAFVAEALEEKLDYIERIDRLTAIAENRRNASLSEIDRRRVVLGATLRQSVHEIEDAEFKESKPRQPKEKTRRDEQSQDQGQPCECAGQHWPENCTGPHSRGAQRVSPRVEPARSFRSRLVRRGRSVRARNCWDRRQCRNPRARTPGGRSADRSQPRAFCAPSTPVPCVERSLLWLY